MSCGIYITMISRCYAITLITLITPWDNPNIPNSPNNPNNSLLSTAFQVFYEEGRTYRGILIQSTNHPITHVVQFFPASKVEPYIQPLKNPPKNAKEIKEKAKLEPVKPDESLAKSVAVVAAEKAGLVTSVEEREEKLGFVWDVSWNTCVPHVCIP